MINIAQLRHAYRTAPALYVDAFHLASGEHAIILGPSGCGKSTLLHLMAGILTPQQGSLHIAGTDVAALTPRAADAWRGKTVGFLPQKLALMPSSSVVENLLLTAYANGQQAAAARAASLLSALGLIDKATAKPHQLSQGQQQRVALARAIFHQMTVLKDDPMGLYYRLTDAVPAMAK